MATFHSVVTLLGSNSQAMITGLFLTFFSTILIFVFSFLPKVTTMPDWYTPVHETLGVFSALGAFPFLGTVMQITLLVLSILAGLQLVVFSNWVYNKIRGSG
jgi:hypothetical protein